MSPHCDLDVSLQLTPWVCSELFVRSSRWAHHAVVAVSSLWVSLLWAQHVSLLWSHCLPHARWDIQIKLTVTIVLAYWAPHYCGSVAPVIMLALLLLKWGKTITNQPNILRCHLHWSGRCYRYITSMHWQTICRYCQWHNGHHNDGPYHRDFYTYASFT